ncbi:Macrolide export ATP-binding/permease protein MacB [Marinomonas spartinae]|uniref:MacB family efflux pump subunit n=1 Tax=Marinomonas spartinae TaxID=1792290 RepID=UPI000808D0B8|nr:MacB family efflux pump subunit [Marinomonas spartinae]SBS39354.1 Macrolide export ATP-binding/permease protein MacB [Marinomonas spartinae]
MGSPLLEIRNLHREFAAGEGVVTILKDINLRIDEGEMVAIVGASGSGKSTLMNILGCLDRPSSGTYRIAERETSSLSRDELAELRREHFGFIFQRYHLLTDISALSNVELPAIYANCDSSVRHERASALLARLGLGDKQHFRPSKLSGGQQQRVSIARALMNGGAVILADEPTGALDKASGVEVMNILRELNTDGHTVILVTHDMEVASHAPRQIEISDGVIVADQRREPSNPPSALHHQLPLRADVLSAFWGGFTEAFRMALRSMNAHRLRTFLTMLGIIIGIAAVVVVVAIGRGAQQQVMRQISDLGTNTLDIYPGSDFGDLEAAAIETLTARDAEALATQPYIDSVTPNVSTSVTALYQNIAAKAQVNGVGADYFRVRGLKLANGRFFNEREAEQAAQVAIIDQRAQAALFAHTADPIGRVVLIGDMPVEIIGVLKPSQNNFTGSSPILYVPYSAVATRLIGKSYLDNITVRLKGKVSSKAAEQAVSSFMVRRHGSKDFSIFNSDQVRQAVERSSATLTLLISAIAAIALLVGGIGVMNIMLVSVTERTGEIGVRMAVGARQVDILQQFLIESVLVCLVGGFIGIALALSVGGLIKLTGIDLPLIYSVDSMLLAVACASLIGIAFGFFPARNASRLDPVQALARD